MAKLLYKNPVPLALDGLVITPNHQCRTRFVRSAIIVMPFDGQQKGFVLAGRSLREVEKREDNLFKLTGIAWVVCLLMSLAILLIALFINSKKQVRLKII